MESYEEKLSLLTELIKLARVDHLVKEEEFVFIGNVAKRLDIDDQTVRSLFEKYQEFLPAELESDRIVQFQRLVLLLSIDGAVRESELDFIRDIGLKMALRSEAIEAVLYERDFHDDGVVPADRLAKIFTTYNN